MNVTDREADVFDAICLVVLVKFSHRRNITMDVVAVTFGNLSAYGIDFLQDGIVCVHVNFHCQTPVQFPRFTIRMSLPGLAFGGRNGRRS